MSKKIAKYVSQQAVNNLPLPEIMGTKCGPNATRNKDLSEKRKYTHQSQSSIAVPLHEEFHLCCTFHTQLDTLDIPFLGEAVSNYK